MKSIELSTGTKKFLLICWVGCCSLFAWNHASGVILLQVPELVPNVVNRNASGKLVQFFGSNIGSFCTFGPNNDQNGFGSKVTTSHGFLGYVRIFRNVSFDCKLFQNL